MSATVLNTKISDVSNKIAHNSKYITTQWFNKLSPEDFAGRLKQSNLVNKTDFDNKLTSLNKQITSNKKNQTKITETKQNKKTYIY